MHTEKWPKLLEKSVRLFEVYDPQYGLRIEHVKDEEREIVNLGYIFQVLSLSFPHYVILVVDATNSPKGNKRLQEVM